jgi:hypothetical protein
MLSILLSSVSCVSGATCWMKTVERYIVCRSYCWRMVSCTPRAVDANASSARGTSVSQFCTWNQCLHLPLSHRHRTQLSVITYAERKWFMSHFCCLVSAQTMGMTQTCPIRFLTVRAGGRWDWRRGAVVPHEIRAWDVPWTAQGVYQLRKQTRSRKHNITYQKVHPLSSKANLAYFALCEPKKYLLYSICNQNMVRTYTTYSHTHMHTHTWCLLRRSSCQGKCIVPKSCLRMNFFNLLNPYGRTRPWGLLSL